MRSVCRIVLCVMAATAASAAVQTAGTLLVNVKASDLSGLNNGDKVMSWPCNGSVGGAFVPAVSGEGAVYQTSVAGAAAVTFAASANSVMTNTVLPPSSILGNNIWSAELWVINPTFENPEDQFSWTQRAGPGWGTDNQGSCMEIRYCADWWNGVEHYGAPNIPWGVAPPAAGVWHHIAITRDSGGTERLYADGVLWTTKTVTLNLRDNGAPFAMGGVMEGGWAMLFSGSLAQVRVHSGTLSSAGVLNNYMEERATYGVTTPPDSAWNGAAGLSLPWSDSANWVGGAVGQSGSRVFIDNGGTAVLTQSVGTVAVFQPTHGGLTMGTDSALAVAAGNGAVWLGSCGGSRFDLTMDAGTFDLQGGNTLTVGAQGGTGIVTLNGGLLNVSGDIALGEGAAGDGKLYLSGGQARVNAIRAVTAGATNRVYFNGGTLLPRVSSGTFMQGLEVAYVQNGGAVFDVTGGVDVTVAQPLLADPDSAGGGLKKFGAGTLTLSGANTFTGDILVGAGDLWFRNAAGLVAGYAGTITMTNADATLGYEKAGGAADLLARMPADSKGSLMLFNANANDTIDFSAHAGLSLSLSGSLNFTGTFIPYASHLVFDVTGVGNVYAPAIAGASSVEVNGSAGSVIEFTGDSSYSGDTEINGGTLIMSHANALGNGAGSITMSNNATLKLNAAGISSAFTQRITADSQGQILLGAACTNLLLDLTGRPGLIVGTDQDTLNYSGTLTPAADTYRVGGGKTVFFFSGNQGLVLSNLTDVSGPAKSVVVEGQGLVRLAAGNTYSGGTVISNSAAVFLAEDGLGAVPGSPDPDNIYVDKGVIRSAGVTFALDANRGLNVGAGGLELHPWSIGTMTVQGDLSGSGQIWTTDSGKVVFGGDANSWSGRLLIGSGANIVVGTGPTLSWNPAAVVAGDGVGGTFNVNNDMDLLWSSTFGSPLGSTGADVGLRKLGTGTLTVDVASVYKQNTLIDSGTLKAGDSGAIPSGAGMGNINIAANSQLDVDGYSLSVNGLSGAGGVSNSGGGSPTLTAGLNDASATFSGSIAPDVLLVKSGAGTQTLGTGVALKDARVEQGTLAMANPTAPTGAVTLAGSGVLRVTGYGASAGDNGLTGFFYDLTPVSANMTPLATLNAWLDPLTPALVASSLGAGAALDFGAGPACVFPAPYNSESRENFVARWIGRFHAETGGDYTFATQSDDGSMVFIDGNVAVNNNGDHGFDKATGAPVTLSAGLHEIVVAFYENGGGQGLTVFVTTPGGSEQTLPQSLLFPTLTPSRFSPLSGAAGTRLEIDKEAAAQVVTDQDATFGGAIVGANQPALLIKSGTGKLTLTSGASQFAGQTQVKDGTLALTGAGTLGPVDVAGAAVLAVSNAPAVLPFPYTTTSGTGLPGAYYDFNQGDQNYSMYNSQATLEAHLAAYTPNLVAGSDLAGATFDFAGNGSKFPGTYGTTPVFQVYWKGVIEIPTAGSYTFFTSSDDGSMLFIDGAAVVNNNYLQGVTERSGTLTLTAGTHAIAIAFYDHGGGWGMYAQIEGPGIAKQLIPNSMLHPAASAFIGALSGAGPVSLENSSAVLRIDEQVSSTYAGDASGPAQSGLQKSGAQTLTLTGDNDAFLGTWSLLAGTLQVGDGGTYGTLGGSAVATAAGSSLVFNRADALDYPGVITGTGEIRSVGAGTVTLSGSLASYNGAIQIAPGQNIALTHALAGSATATNNGTLSLTGTSFAGDGTRIGGSGTTLVQDGARLTLANPAAFPNSVALEGGVLAMPVTGETLSNLTVRAGATSELALNVLASNQVWSIDQLTLEAGSLLQAGASYFGLYGKYYDRGINNEMFETVADFENAISGLPVQVLASSMLVGATFDFGDGGMSTLFPGKYQNNAEQFCVSWKGKIKIDVAGVYTFATTSDDQSMIFIDGTQVVKNNYWQGMTTRSGTINLAVGLHDIRILFGQGGGGYGIDVDITVPGEASKRLPNAMLIPDPDDIPTYVVDAARLAVTNGPGTAAIALAGDGTLRMKDLWFDAGAVLAVTGQVAVAGSTLTVTVPQEVSFGAHLVADFTATPGLSLSGVTLTAVGTEGHLVYRDKMLYLVRSTGTLLLFR